MKIRDLEKARVILEEATQLGVQYVFDDLVFPEHAAFILQFDDKDPNKFYIYFHKDCTEGDRGEIFDSIVNTCIEHKCSIEDLGKFTMTQKGEEIELQFL